ncbi:hypothetical protein MKW98_009854, partial [Papaver atlanticum]
MLHGFLTNMGNGVCVWENLDFVQILKGTNVHILCGGKLLSKVMNMQPYLLVMHITTEGAPRETMTVLQRLICMPSHSQTLKLFSTFGYMHEHGQGRPLDLHLAKRYYDQALEIDPAAKLPVTLALMSLYVRKNYENTILVDMIDALPGLFPKVEVWVDKVIMDEGNATILTLFICLLTVLYLRERQRRHAVAAAGDL